MAELVDATDLKSVGIYSRAGSIPAFRTTFKKHPFWGVFLCQKKTKGLSTQTFKRFNKFSLALKKQLFYNKSVFGL